jgi:hypothetical protein
MGGTGVNLARSEPGAADDGAGGCVICSAAECGGCAMGRELCVLVAVLGLALAPAGRRSVTADDKPAPAVSAKELGKGWRYPGTSNDAEIKDAKDPRWVWEYSGPLGEKLKNLDRTTMQLSKPKASFEDVWNFYAGKCGYPKKWAKDSFHAVIERTEGNGQRMVIDRGLAESGTAETHFGLFTDRYVVHVQVRKVDAEYTEVRVLTTLR